MAQTRPMTLAGEQPRSRDHLSWQLARCQEPRHRSEQLYAVSKRAVDIVGAAIGLVLLLPLLLIASVAIVLNSPGSPLYLQDRVGQYGRRFRVVKLRTMVPGAEGDGRAVWASDPDPRVTAVGRFLRRTHFDEAPQLLNVLLGQMSLVGPRPERPEFVELLAAQIPCYLDRHQVRPGITGWAQINYKYGASIEDAARKQAFDRYYVRHRSFSLDARILLRTLLLVCSGRIA